MTFENKKLSLLLNSYATRKISAEDQKGTCRAHASSTSPILQFSNYRNCQLQPTYAASDIFLEGKAYHGIGVIFAARNARVLVAGFPESRAALVATITMADGAGIVHAAVY